MIWIGIVIYGAGMIGGYLYYRHEAKRGQGETTCH